MNTGNAVEKVVATPATTCPPKTVVATPTDACNHLPLNFTSPQVKGGCDTCNHLQPPEPERRWLHGGVSIETPVPTLSLAAATPGGQRRAEDRICPACGSLVLVGWDNDLCALFAAVDPDPIDYLTEVTAWLAGRATYDLNSRAGEPILTARDEHARLPSRWTVVAQHLCKGAAS